MWSAAVLALAEPGRSSAASGSPVPSGPWSRKASSGWKPKVRLNVGAADSFSECATTNGRVEVDDHFAAGVPGNWAAVLPGPFPGRRPGGAQSGQRGVDIAGQAIDAPGHRGVGGHRPEQPRPARAAP